MIHIDEYSKLCKVSRRQLERFIDSSKLASEKINGQRYIIVPPTVDPINPAGMSPKKFKEEIRAYVRRCGIPYLKEAFKRVEAYEKATGHKVKGLSKRTLYGIANGNRPVFHKKRKDSGTVRNTNLVATQDKIEAMIAFLYMKSGEPSMSFITKRIQELAQVNESLYEIAAIPEATIYRHCRRFIADNDYKSCWQYYNRHKDWLKKLPKVQGAFTDNIEFMDYIAFDDRKADVAGSWYYDEVSAKWKLRKVWYWIAIEMLTMQPVGWVILPREPNSEDVINVLLQSMIKVGVPTKGYLFDNGIGSSDRVKSFVDKVKFQLSGGDHLQNEFKPVSPYEPTHKSNIELFNRHLKNEHDIWFKNYVGGDRKEVRHSGKRLMPEDCDHLVSEYIDSANAYLTGDCINRKRNRVIKSKLYKTSISELFQSNWDKYKAVTPNESSLRWALLEDAVIRKFEGKISIKRQGVRFDYMDSDYNPGLEGREFIISMMPTNLSKMDIYATEDFADPLTGKIYQRGDFVTTLQSSRELPGAERQALVFKNRKQAANYMKKVKERLLDAALGQFPELIPIVNTFITIDGKAIEIRKQLLKRMDDITEATPLNSIAEFIRHECAVISEEEKSGNVLTTTEEKCEMKLTIEGEDWQ